MAQKCLLERFLQYKSQIKQQRQTFIEQFSVQRAELYAYVADNVNFMLLNQAIPAKKAATFFTVDLVRIQFPLYLYQYFNVLRLQITVKPQLKAGLRKKYI